MLESGPQFLLPGRPGSGKIIFIANEPFCRWYSHRFSLSILKEAGFTFEVWSLGKSQLREADPTQEVIDVSTLRKLHPLLALLTEADQVVLVDGFRRHERLSHFTLRWLLSNSKGRVSTVLFPSSPSFYLPLKEKIATAFLRPRLVYLALKDMRKFLYVQMRYRFAPNLVFKSRLKLDEVYKVTPSNNDLDEQLVAPKTRFLFKRFIHQSTDASNQFLRSPFYSESKTPLCLVVDPGFWLHSEDESYPRLVRGYRPKDPLSTSRKLMLPALEKITQELGESWRVIISIHPNSALFNIANPYEPYECRTGRTSQQLSIAKLVVTFGSSLTEDAVRLEKNLILIDTQTDLATSVALYNLKKRLPQVRLWTYKWTIWGGLSDITDESMRITQKRTPFLSGSQRRQ